VGALHGAVKAGLQLPEDLSVTGFDDIPLASYVLPELTTVAQPITQMAEHAVNRLLLLIQEHLVRLTEDPELKPQCMVLPTSLIVRNSTVAPQGDRFGRSATRAQSTKRRKTRNKRMTRKDDRQQSGKA
jgi:DNA-binding LacI/PurR family transcriptional regulator